MSKQLISEIKKLKEDISPRSEWVTLNRDFLLRQISDGQELNSQKIGALGYFQFFIQTLRQTVMEPAVMMLFVLGVFLSSSLTINAAYYSLPGDNLYPVKITLEKTHLALVTNDEQKVELKIEFAQKRVAELTKVLSQNDTPEVKKRKIETVAKEFRNNVASVSSDLIKISDMKPAENVDPGNSVRMALTVSEKTGELAKSFNNSVINFVGTEKTQLQEIVSSAAEVAEGVSIAAKQIVDDANKELATTTPVVAEETSSQGEVEGVSNEDDVEESAGEPTEGVETGSGSGENTQSPDDVQVEEETKEVVE